MSSIKNDGEEFSEFYWKIGQSLRGAVILKHIRAIMFIFGTVIGCEYFTPLTSNPIAYVFWAVLCGLIACAVYAVVASITILIYAAICFWIKAKGVSYRH